MNIVPQVFIEIPTNEDHTNLHLISLDIIGRIDPIDDDTCTITYKDGNEEVIYHSYTQTKRLIGAASIITDTNGAPL